MHTTTDFIHNASRFPLGVVDAGTYHASQDKDYPRHQHPSWEILYFLEGKIELVTDRQRCGIEPGMLLAIPPHIIHTELARTAYRDYYIQLAGKADLAWPFLCYDDAQHGLRDTCAAIVREWQGRSAPGREEMLPLLLRQLEIQIQRSHGRQRLPAAERIVHQAELLLERCADRPLRIQALVRQLGTSPSALRAHFARLRGYSPLAYLHRVRAERARALLQDTDLKLEAVAAHCGYHSASHLSRQIKSLFGIAPGDLRKGNS